MFTTLSAQALPVLMQHVDTSRVRMESGAWALTAQFGVIVGQPDKILRISGALGGNEDDSGFFRPERRRRRLVQVVREPKQIHGSRSGLAEEIRAGRGSGSACIVPGIPGNRQLDCHPYRSGHSTLHNLTRSDEQVFAQNGRQ
jgi:hypothetical protein